jgi:hypothetical protein
MQANDYRQKVHSAYNPLLFVPLQPTLKPLIWPSVSDIWGSGTTGGAHAQGRTEVRVSKEGPRFKQQQVMNVRARVRHRRVKSMQMPTSLTTRGHR